jgi:hypothetical protein
MSLNITYADLNGCGNIDAAAGVVVLGSNLVDRQPRTAVEGIDVQILLRPVRGLSVGPLQKEMPEKRR